MHSLSPKTENGNPDSALVSRLEQASTAAEKAAAQFEIAFAYLQIHEVQNAKKAAELCRNYANEAGIRELAFEAALIEAECMLTLSETAAAREVLKSVGKPASDTDLDKQMLWVSLYSRSMKGGDKKVVVKLVNNALENAMKHGLLHWEGIFQCDLGDLYLHHADFVNALAHFNMAKDLAETQRRSNILERSLTGLGITYNRFSDHENAMTFLFKALELTEKSGHPFNLATCQFHIGLVYSELKDHDEAFRWYSLAADFLKKYEVSRDLIACLNNMTFSHMEKGNFDKALAHHKEVMQLAENFKSARVYKVLRTTLGSIYRRKKQYKEAYEVLFKLHNLPKHKYYSLEITVVIELAKCKLKLGKLDGLDELLYEGIARAELQNSPQHLSILHNLRYKFARKRGDNLEALRALEKKAKHDEEFSHMELSRRIRNIEQIHELKRREEKRKMLRHQHAVLAGSNEELVHFAESVAHDLKAPLRTISSFTGLLEREHSRKDEPRNERLQQISFTAAQMEKKLNNLLELALVGTIGEELVPVSLAKVVEEVVLILDDLISDADATVKFGKLPTVYGNHDSLLSLFENLMINALQASLPGTNPLLEIVAESEDDHVIVSFIDNGPGMEQSELDRWNRFFESDKSSSSGTGLGFAICRKAIRLMNSTIKVESANVSGTKFDMKLALVT